ncbi:thiamin biosynthesis sulfur carrier protein [Syntrophotalea carbinolica DSM 2380]|uniref:Thiamin biosynthesis sulfur carrier protein n=1 Tax=Syntrophotalea carbinolica (strain DSM 2380 / NBRC 103641 / GraBd1) TaxID=338963 RepID=Q3A6Y8_SYNC1|nr:sulfur carrier protein ThiS [Syntrophotalea carbinolica]ABA87869.1 thiamin biosynthesis sulfur carrier protein [Syntrophotalea carbinolica DSM 2380]
MLTLTVNGKTRTYHNLASLSDLLQQLQFDPERVAIEYNGTIVTRDRFATTALHTGDRVEIVQFVGGG